MLGIRRVVVLAAVALVACGVSSSSSDTSGARGAERLMPSDNQVTGWTRSEPIRLLPAAKAGEGAPVGVNGDAARFIANGLVNLGIARYKTSGTETLELRIWEMSTPAAAGTCWTDLIANDTRYSGGNWSAVTVGEAGRLSDSGSYWWVLARKGAFIVEVWLDPDDPAQRQVAIDFAKAVVAAIP